MLELQAGDLRAEVDRYLGEGETLSALHLLQRFLAKLCFCPTAERKVEGDHAQAWQI